MKPTFGSLFTGIGGIDLGLERAGWECRWQVEIDEYCQAVLRKHWPDVPKYGDVRDITEGQLERTDLVCGGFPCQPVSQAGKQAGEQDERWLWPEFARIIRLLRPRWVMLENVTGLLVRGMGQVLADLSASGYDTEWQSIRASTIGAPHERERVYLVAYAKALDGQPWMGNQLQRSGPILRPDRFERAGFWLRTTSRPYRMADGFSRRLYKYRVGALGNAVVPQVAEWIGKRILGA